MKWFYQLKKFFIDKKNLELQSIKYKNNFLSNKYITVFFLKENVISNDIYDNLELYFQENLTLYSKIHTHIFNNTYYILKIFDNHIKNISSIKRQENPFFYSFKINFDDFKKGYINLDFYPNIFLNNEQINSLNKLFLKEFFKISHLLLINNPFITESEKYINNYSHMNQKEAIENIYNKMTDLLNHFYNKNKQQDIYEKYSEIKRKKSYY
jgi:hypothetical protein